MPVIACPGCGKKYKLPATVAAGQVAKCSDCGKRFRLGAARAPAANTSQTVSNPQSTHPKPAPSPVPRVSEAAAATSNEFWDDVLSEEDAATPATGARVVSAPARPAGKPVSKSATPSIPAQSVEKPKKPKKRKKKVRWGFQWEKVAGGGAAFLIAGGITVALVLTTGYLYYWPAGIAVVGFFTMLSGLMGEEGIW